MDDDHSMVIKPLVWTGDVLICGRLYDVTIRSYLPNVFVWVVLMDDGYIGTWSCTGVAGSLSEAMAECNKVIDSLADRFDIQDDTFCIACGRSICTCDQCKQERGPNEPPICVRCQDTNFGRDIMQQWEDQKKNE